MGDVRREENYDIAAWESKLPMEMDREAKLCPCRVYAHEFIGKLASLIV